VFFHELFNSTLNLKVHSACGGSNKALRCGIYDFRSEPIDGLLNGVARDAIALAEDCNFFPVNIHERKPLPELLCLLLLVQGCRSSKTDIPSLN